MQTASGKSIYSLSVFNLYKLDMYILYTYIHTNTFANSFVYLSFILFLVLRCLLCALKIQLKTTGKVQQLCPTKVCFSQSPLSPD